VVANAANSWPGHQQSGEAMPADMTRWPDAMIYSLISGQILLPDEIQPEAAGAPQANPVSPTDPIAFGR
jgi:hypothetical protein